MRNPIRMPDRVADRDGATLRYTQQRETIDTSGVDDGFEIVDEVFVGNVGNLAVR
jgi:hypothetical protein